ncbi:cholesterol 25-hydroxylase [Lecanosticta acicola]|uniref:Cholesterol 25-hydroxylase n=1 Tax=Lecanosticta acicola TaxID=111012 RepID=A0AAI9E9J4_9PEZI|nr:cholesterol 25-hydroxylase [Lecanosticta acicola]
MVATRNVYVFYGRAFSVVLFASAVLAPQLWQPFMTVTWAYLRSWSVYKWSTFETLWTVFCYAAIEPYLTVVFFKHPEWRIAHEKQTAKTPPKPKGMRRPARRGLEALTYVAPLLMLDLLMIKKFANVSLEDMLQSGNYDPSLASAGGHKATFLVPSLHNFSLASPLQTTRALPVEPPSSRRLALELVTSLVIYDALFFAFHLAMHLLPGLRAWHRPHHSHGEIHPQVTNQLHIFERLGLVLLANFSLNIIGSHVLTRTIFVPIFVHLLVEIHSGLDLPWGYEKMLPAGWGGGARKHAKHHRDGEGGFEPYFNWCDGIWQGLISRV